MLLPLAIILPAVLAGFALLPGVRRYALDLGIAAPLPALAASVLVTPAEAFMLPDLLLGMRLQLTATGAVFLAGSALLWLACAVYARTALREADNKPGFALFWNLALSGMVTVILAADAASFYAGFTLVSLISWPLILHERTDRARRAGHVYITLAIGGEIALLAALVMAVEAAGGTLDIASIRGALPGSAHADIILGLLAIAFGIKAALIPLHVWAPLAYRAACVPAAAVLSGSIAKAGIVGLLAFMPLDAAPQFPGAWLAGLGFAGAFAAALAGLAMTHPRTVLAYSSISQLGLMTGTAGLALATGLPADAVIAAVAVYAFHHGLAKGALFLGTGAAAHTGGAAATRLRWIVGAAALSIAGFPLTGGMVAKLALKHEMPAVLQYAVIVSAVTTLLVLLRFMNVLRSNERADARAPLTLSMPVLVLSAGAIGLPWTMLGLLPVAPGYPFEPGNLLNAAWPVAAALVMFWLGRLWRGPPLPAGDILDPVLKAAGPARARLSRLALFGKPALPDFLSVLRERCGPWLDRAEAGLGPILPALLLLAVLTFAGGLWLAACFGHP